MIRVRTFFLLILLCATCNLSAGKISKGYSALKIYNYFEAKRLFQSSLKKETSAAAFGLSVIYFRTDNPFSNIDSAYKYIILSETKYAGLSEKRRMSYKPYGLSFQAIDSLKGRIHQTAFEFYKKQNSIPAFDKFISYYITAPECFDAIDLRNALAFREAEKLNTFEAYEKFIYDYPLSRELKEAKERFHLTKFQALTKNNTIREFEQFLIEQLGSPFATEAKNSIYLLSTKNGTTKEFYDFIKKYPDNPNLENAWMTLYSVSAGSYEYSSLINFSKQYPDFPFRELLNQDIDLSRKVLFPIREKGKWGFADSMGYVAIPCIYEWVEGFSEGLAECGLNN
nr:WG repeat-containing protein [Bacteroidota bacterium]